MAKRNEVSAYNLRKKRAEAEYRASKAEAQRLEDQAAEVLKQIGPRPSNIMDSVRVAPTPNVNLEDIIPD